MVNNRNFTDYNYIKTMRMFAAINPNRLPSWPVTDIKLLCAMAEVAHLGPIPMGKWAEKINVNPVKTGQAMDRLEKAKLAKRSRSKTDRRVVLAEITDSGRGIVEDWSK